MAPPPPHPVPRETVESAVSALTRWMRKRAAEAPPNLLADERDDVVLLQLSLRRIPAEPAARPRLLPLPHPVIAHSAASVCVISDDGPKSRSPPAADLLDRCRSLQLPVSEVIPLSRLRTDYRPYESRRRLAGSHDLFVADRAIIPLLPRHLGKAFYSKKKAPIGVDFARVGWPEQVRKVLGSSFLYLRTGTCSTVKVGRLDMKEEDIVENVVAAVDAAVENVPKKWGNVRALHLKAQDSVALPIYQVVPELGMKIEVSPAAQLEGGDLVDAADSSELSKKKKKMLKGADGGSAEDKSGGKRKRDKKKQTEDVVMQEEVQAEPEKKKSKSNVAPVAEVQKVGKKGKRTLEKDAQTSKDNKGRKSEPASEEVDNTEKQAEDVVMQEEAQAEPKKKKSKGNASPTEEVKKAGKKGKRTMEKDAEASKGRKSEPALEEVSNTKKKGKKEDANHESEGDVVDVASIKNKKGKKKKSIEGEGDDNVESLEDKKSKGKKSDGEKIKKTRTRVRV